MNLTKTKARASSCLSNTKQFGTALQLYLDDYDETYPKKSDEVALNDTNCPYYYFRYTVPNNNWRLVDYSSSVSARTSWMDAIFPYVKNYNMFVCPSGVKNVPGYGMNIYLGGFDTSKADRYTPAGCIPPSISEIKNPSEVVAFADTNILLTGGLYYTVCAIFPKAIGDYAESTSAGKRHINGCNFTLADGHAKYYKYGAGPTEKWITTGNNEGTKDPWWNFREAN